MFWFLILAILLMNPSPLAAAEEHWIQTDIRGLENAPPPAGEPLICARLWIEERTWRFATRAERLVGIYGNTLRTVPLGTTLPSCQFSTKPAKPLAFTARMWGIQSSVREDGAWSVQLTPAGEMTGDELDLEHPPFSTHLFAVGDRLIDSTSTVDAVDRLAFRRPEPVPADLLGAVQSIFEDLHTGGCLRIMSRALDNPTDPEQVAPMIAATCDLRQRMIAIAGPLVSVNVDLVTTVDRVATSVAWIPPGDEGRAGTSYLVQATVHYERQVIPTTALFTQEEDSWRLVRLWY